MSDVVESQPAAVELAAPLDSPFVLSALSLEVVIDSVNRTPDGKAIEIVEIKLAPIEIAGVWMDWADKLRLRCERGQGKALAAKLGLLPAS